MLMLRYNAAMNLLEEIQAKLDTHQWGERRYAKYCVGGRLVKNISYRKCLVCNAYNSPNSVKECPKS